MVDFAGYYSFPADQVECVEASTREDKTYPFVLTVSLKSGRRLSVNYAKREERDRVRLTLIDRISHELRSDYERLYNKLYLIDDAVKRIDKRQLRIWRQLNALLRLDKEDEPRTNQQKGAEDHE